MLRNQVDLRKKCKYFGIRNFKYFFSARNVKILPLLNLVDTSF